MGYHYITTYHYILYIIPFFVDLSWDIDAVPWDKLDKHMYQLDFLMVSGEYDQIDGVQWKVGFNILMVTGMFLSRIMFKWVTMGLSSANYCNISWVCE